MLPSQVPNDLFLACFGDNVQAAAAAEFAYHDLGVRKITVLYDQDMEYTRLLQNYFRRRFTQLGGTVVEAAPLQSKEPGSLEPTELIFLAVGPQDALQSVKSFREKGVNVPILGGDSYDSDVWNGQLVSDIYFTTHAYLGEASNEPRVQAFRNAYLKRYGEAPDAFSGLGFDAVNLVLHAVERAGSRKPEAVLQALSETRDFRGVTGRISYDDGSRIPRKSVTIMKVKDGETTFVKDWMPEKVPSPELSAKSSLVAPGAELQKLAGGLSFAEGLTRAGSGDVYFTDQPNNRILRWSEGRLETFLEPAGRANGMHFQQDGTLLVCADERNELWSVTPEGEVKVLLGAFQGEPLNGPNDLWVHPDGSLYFTDPFYQRDWWTHHAPPQPTEQVYRFSADRKSLQRVTEGLQKPNGIVGTPDGKFLYVADIGAHRTYRFRIAPDGTLGGKTLFCPMGSDGMTLDEEGNLYLTGHGVTVFDSTGEKIAHFSVPEKWTGNICFGGADRKTLFIAASSGLYSLPMRVRGANLAK